MTYNKIIQFTRSNSDEVKKFARGRLTNIAWESVRIGTVQSSSGPHTIREGEFLAEDINGELHILGKEK